MLLEILAKLVSESLLSLYPIFVKKIGISSILQLWSRLITYVVIAAAFVDWSFIIFNSYPLMILLLAGVVWHNSYLFIFIGLALFILGQDKARDAATGVDFYYGVGMILMAALTEAFLYFLVRRVKTSNNWNHLFISYFLGAVIMTAYVVYNHQEYVVEDKTRVGLSIIINGVIGSVGYVLRFFSSYRLDPAIYAPLSYFGVVMSYIYGMLFDNETLNWKKILGTVSILVSNYFAPKRI